MNFPEEPMNLNDPYYGIEKQKTEGLSFQQACAAIGRGECVENKDLSIYSLKGVWSNHSWWSNHREFNPDSQPYKIVPDPSKQVEEKPSLTYEQALECEKVNVFLPQLNGIPAIYSKSMDVWPMTHLHDFDLAERRGYRIEAVD